MSFPNTTSRFLRDSMSALEGLADCGVFIAIAFARECASSGCHRRSRGKMWNAICFVGMTSSDYDKAWSHIDIEVL
ncbi:hypothetical protein D9M72_369230 [compost metagenome]